MRASPAKYNLAFPAGTFYTAGETPRAPRGTELAKMQCFGLRGCFWGDAHAGVSSQVQLGAPLLFPCGHYQPTTSRCVSP